MEKLVNNANLGLKASLTIIFSIFAKAKIGCASDYFSFFVLHFSFKGAIFVLNKNKQIVRQTYKEAVKYGIVGVTGLLVEWLTFFFFRDVVHIDFSVAHVLSAVCGTINNFIFNRIYTFKATDKPFRRAVSFFSIAAVGWLIGYFLIMSFVYLFDHYLCPFLRMDDVLIKENQAIVQNIAKLCAIVIVAGLQFFANKYITFKKEDLSHQDTKNTKNTL